MVVRRRMKEVTEKLIFKSFIDMHFVELQIFES